jgi:hypothetical protein
MRQEDIDKLVQEGAIEVRQQRSDVKINEADPAIKAFLADIWAVYKRHDLALDRMSADEPLLIRRLQDTDEEFLKAACDTTSPNLQVEDAKGKEEGF